VAWPLEDLLPIWTTLAAQNPARRDRNGLTAQLVHLAPHGRVQQIVGHPNPAGGVRIQDRGAVFGDHPDAELGVAGRAELPHGQHIKRRSEPLGDLERDRHPAAWQRDHDRPLPRQRCELLG
jgi:hypothetical protein